MTYEYYEIRPCVEHDGDVSSFLGQIQGHHSNGDEIFTRQEAEKEAKAFAQKVGSTVFWTLYGRILHQQQAIGDFKSFEDAFGVLRSILAPLRAAADLMDGLDLPAGSNANTAYALLEDICNQSTPEDRL